MDETQNVRRSGVIVKTNIVSNRVFHAIGDKIHFHSAHDSVYVHVRPSRHLIIQNANQLEHECKQKINTSRDTKLGGVTHS